MRVQFLAFRLQEVAAERDALSTDLRKTKVQPLPMSCMRILCWIVPHFEVDSSSDACRRAEVISC